jgi:hypothetical protein
MPSDEDRLYYQTVLAHRTYQYSMCIFKQMRYQGNSEEDLTLTWHKVDAWLRKSIERYNSLKVEGLKQPIFIDYIIKLTICRGYANNKNKKLLTAEKILESAKVLIGFITKGKI